MTKVSVIIPNYNRAAIVGETIENMLRQSLSPYEVIVVDDGSTDSSVEIIRSFGARVTLIQQKNQGPGAARNAGLKIASGQFIQLMDSDDLASLNKLEDQARALLQNEADVVYSPWARVFFELNTVRLQDVVLQQQALPTVPTAVQHFLTGWSIVLQQCLLRTSFIRKIGFYRTDMSAWEDGDLFLRMLLARPKLIFSNTSLLLYRLDDYGKLTISGTENLSKVEDCGRFLVSAYNLSRKHAWSQSAVEQPAFLSNVWKTLSQLENSITSEQALIDQLQEVLQQRDFMLPLSFYTRFYEIAKGVQQRIKGHRWSSSYRSSSLTNYQKELIAELGFSVV